MVESHTCGFDAGIMRKGRMSKHFYNRSGRRITIYICFFLWSWGWTYRCRLIYISFSHSYGSSGCSDSGLQLVCIVVSGVSRLPPDNTPLIIFGVQVRRVERPQSGFHNTAAGPQADHFHATPQWIEWIKLGGKKIILYIFKFSEMVPVRIEWTTLLPSQPCYTTS